MTVFSRSSPGPSGPARRKPRLRAFFTAVNAGLVVTFVVLVGLTDLGLEKVAIQARQTRDVTVPQVVAQHRQAMVASQMLRLVTVISRSDSSPTERRDALAKAESLSDAFDTSRDLEVLERFDAVLGRLNALSYQLDLISLLAEDLREKRNALAWVQGGWPQEGALPDGGPAIDDLLSLRWLVPEIPAGRRDEALQELRRLKQILTQAVEAISPAALKDLNQGFDATVLALTTLAPEDARWPGYRDRTARLFTIRQDILKGEAAVKLASEEVDRSLDQMMAALSEQAAELAHDGAEQIVALTTSVFWTLALYWALAVILLAAILWVARRSVLIPILSAVSALDRVRLGIALGSLPTARFHELAAINETVAQFSEALIKEHDFAEALAKSEALYRHLVETIPHGIVSIDAEGTIGFENGGHRRLRGLTDGSSVGDTIWSLLRTPVDEVPAQERLAHMRCGRLPAAPLLGCYARDDGSAIDVQIDWDQTVNAAGTNAGLILIITDVTDRRRALKVEAMAKAKELAEDSRRRAEAALQELQATQRQLIQSEKMASLGTLVAGVAHEVNSPLSVALISATHLSDETERLIPLYQTNQLRKRDLAQYLDTGTEALQLLLNNLQRACHLVQSFKQVAHDQATDSRRHLPLKSWMNDIVFNLLPKIRQAGHRLTVTCPEDIEVDSYPGALAQILTNLIMNSIDHGYSPSQTGSLSLSVTRTGEDSVEFIYCDDGRGIAPEIQNRIFDPFFTTRRAAGNTGLGLHIIFNIITGQLGGAIHLESGPTRGARFVITLPRVAPKLVAPTADAQRLS